MRHAFVIGSNGPPSFGTVQQLVYAESDALRVAKCLASDTCGFRVKRPTLEMRPKDVVEDIESLCESLEADDDLLLYFSGHGILDAKGNLLLLWNQSTPNALLTSTIATSKIMSALEACRAKNKLLVLDCCHAGAAVSLTGFKGAAEISLSDRIVPPENYAIIMASGRFDSARELEHIQAGFLTDTFCKGLTERFSQADRDGDKRISVADISWWLAQCADEHNTAHPSERVPYPSVFGRTRGDFYLTLGLDDWAPHEIEWPNGTTMVVLPIKSAYSHDEAGYAICISKHPVTNAQYASFVESTGTPAPAGEEFILVDRGADPYGEVGAWQGPFEPWTDERFNIPNMPVVCVGLRNAEQYCVWLGRQAGHEARLPTARLWDYAAFGTIYPSRDPRTWLRTAARIRDNAASPEPVSNDPHRLNQFGLSDMIGNVWEWCEMPRPQISLLGDFRPEFALRGGGYLDDLSAIEPFLSGAELKDGEDTSHTDLGFRVAGIIPLVLLDDVVCRQLSLADVVPVFHDDPDDRP